MASEELENLREEIRRELKRSHDPETIPPAPALMARWGRALLELDPIAALDHRDLLHEAAVDSPWAPQAKATLALLADDPFWAADEEKRRYGGSDD